MPSRNTELLEKRNQKIYSKYKQLYDVNSLRHEKVLELLSEEFFLSERTIEGVVLGIKKQSKPTHEKSR